MSLNHLYVVESLLKLYLLFSDRSPGVFGCSATEQAGMTYYVRVRCLYGCGGRTDNPIANEESAASSSVLRYKSCTNGK